MIKINKSQWKTYKFGDIASSISERAEPKETKLDIYVGLEHLDPDCIHIKRKGHPSDVKGTKLRVYPGDIIFGKRRAYQRKAAIVDFNGICSAHAMVVRANPEVILPELMPFFIHSDVFMHRAVDVSEGSLSPTIKWKILAEQQFRMPPLGDQKRIAVLLWSIDRTIDRYAEVINHLSITYQIELKNISVVEGDEKKIGDVSHLHYGEGLREQDRRDGPYLVIGSSGVVGKHIECRVKGPGIVVGRKGSAGEVLWIGEDFWPIDTTYWVEIKNRKYMSMEYFYYVLKSLNLPSLTITTAVPGLNRDDVLLKTIRVPRLSVQSKVVEKFRSIQMVKEEVAKHILDTKNIQKQIINQIFG